MKVVLVSEFKAKCIGLLSAVAAGGEDLLVTRRGVPLARVVPVPPESSEARCLGDSAATVRIQGDLLSNEFSNDWESLEG